MTYTISREIRLKNRPEGMVRETDFELVEFELPEIVEGEILVQTIYMSVDPYMRGRMKDRKSYIPPFQLGEPLDDGRKPLSMDLKMPPRHSLVFLRVKTSEK